MRIRKGDTVEVISGDDKGTRGTVNRVILGREFVRRRGQKGRPYPGPDPDRARVLVSGVNLVKKHQRRTGNVRTQVGIIEREEPIHLSNVALVCPHCQKKTRVGYQVVEGGKKIRVCKSCTQTID
ncbi:MAG: 50S ribosomal protein L24 [Chloroflexi bacterium]|nr:50S ribosomal protein L24 [Chloroflexota bacterium]